jgi:hypothetical protein
VCSAVSHKAVTYKMLSSNRRFFDQSVKTLPVEKLMRYITFWRKKSIVLSSAQCLPPPIQCLINRYVTFRRLNLPASVRRSPRRFNTCRWSTMEYVLSFLLLNIGLLPLWGILFICTQITVMVDDEQKNC